MNFEFLSNNAKCVDPLLAIGKEMESNNNISVRRGSLNAVAINGENKAITMAMTVPMVILRPKIALVVLSFNSLC